MYQNTFLIISFGNLNRNHVTTLKLSKNTCQTLILLYLLRSLEVGPSSMPFAVCYGVLEIE